MQETWWVAEANKWIWRKGMDSEWGLTVGPLFDHKIAFIVVVQSLSRVQLFVTWWTAARQASLSFTISRSLLKFISIKSVMPSNHLILCHHLLLLSSIFPSIRVFSNESALCIRWPKSWSFGLSLSKEHPGLISFRMDWLDLLAVQGTLKSLLQHHNLKASVLQRSAFLMVRLSHVHNCQKIRSFDDADLCRQRCLRFLIYCLGFS